jgi:hypothetical protein
MAALSVGSRRLPGIAQRHVLPIASIPCGGYNRPIELPHLETFPGAACLPTDRAARLQSGLPDVASRSFRRRGEVWLPSRRSVRSTRGVFATLSRFLPHRSESPGVESCCPFGAGNAWLKATAARQSLDRRRMINGQQPPAANRQPQTPNRQSPPYCPTVTTNVRFGPERVSTTTSLPRDVSIVLYFTAVPPSVTDVGLVPGGIT